MLTILSYMHVHILIYISRCNAYHNKVYNNQLSLLKYYTVQKVMNVLCKLQTAFVNCLMVT